MECVLWNQKHLHKCQHSKDNWRLHKCNSRGEKKELKMEKPVLFSDQKWHTSHLKVSRMPWSNTSIIRLLKAVFERKETVQETLDYSWNHNLLEIYGWRVGTGWINYKHYLAEYQKEGKARSLRWWCVTAIALKGRAEHAALRLAKAQKPAWATKQSHRDLTKELLSKQKVLHFLLIQYPSCSFLVRNSIFMAFSCKIYVILTILWCPEMKLYFPRDTLFWQLRIAPRHLLTSNKTQATGPQSLFCTEQFVRDLSWGLPPAHCWGHGTHLRSKAGGVTVALWSSPGLRQDNNRRN